MANIFTPSIEGDGINFSFFQNLWQKNRNEEKEKSHLQGNIQHNKSDAIPLRLPDTVIFQLGQPLQWYFTSERGRQTIILRKRKQNVHAEKIEEEFLRRCKGANKGCMCENDIVAYFIASSDCTLRNRKHGQGKANGEDGTFDDDKSGYHSTDEDQSKNEDSICDIEYFNAEGLHEFLHKRRKNQSGILQRFVEPSGGGTHNSQIRAICTPKMCVLERRKTKQELHDSRFGLYERAVTFEGPEVHSKSLPLRGVALSGKLRALCERVLIHTSEATKGRRSCREDVRMVLNLKVDSKDRIWLLYSSSIRTVHSSKTFHSVGASEAQNTSIINSTLNVQDVIKLSPKIKLSQTANHDPTNIISNTKGYSFCPSCGLVQLAETFHPVPYKTIVTHYEQVMTTSNNQCPPPKEIIISAGGVGFGKLPPSETKCDTKIEEEDLVIPPVIRYFHKRLKAEGYRRYRSDPLFLHKHCKLCENCFLSYANLVSTSFQIKIPIKLDTELKRLGFDSKGTLDSKILKSSLIAKDQVRLKSRTRNEHIDSFGSEIYVPVPSFPSAIIDPPTKYFEEDMDQLMSLPYESIESSSQPLKHLLDMHEALEKTKTKQKETKPTKIKINPYKVPLRFVHRTTGSKKKRKTCPRDVNLDTEGVIERNNTPKGKCDGDIQLLSNALTELTSRE